MDVDVVARESVLLAAERQRVRAKVLRLGRMTPLLERAEIRLVVDEEAPLDRRWRCDAVVTGHGHALRCRAHAADAVAAADDAVGKLSHQVERLKGKLVARSQPPRRSDPVTLR